MPATFERGPLAPSAPPERTFPLVRHLSYRLTPALVRLPVTANQITAASLVAGLGCAWCYMQGGRVWALGGSALFILCYVLDNCDGEIARLKGLQSDFGMRLDSFADWLVHTAFFVALGIGIGKESGEDLWLWLGWLAAAGATINHILVLTLDARSGSEHDPERTASFEPATPGRMGKAVYIYRELLRADFCFVLLLLTLFEVTWFLLPVAAIGTQLYWAMALTKGARDHRL
ncbi:MAG: CDP-alcohol phosphatidyltransferase family protein [Proteobacteria bacterium]|nr:CDP-alcohol phosphatidyltransferase family protein [Pseudomonadota bacterium]